MIHRNGKVNSKSRSSSSTVSVPIKYQTYSLADGSLTYSSGNGDYVSRVMSEKITSTNRSSARSGHANNCFHVVEKTNINTGVGRNSLWYSAANPTVLQVVHDSGTDAVACLAIAKSQVLAQFPISGENFLRNNAVPLITENFDRMRPDLTELSVPNFLLDLNQISKLVKLWKYRAPLVKNLANLNLNVQYGWRPTIGDSKGMVEAISGFQAKIKAFQDRLGKLTTKQVIVATGNEAVSGTTVSGPYTIRWSGSQRYTCTAHIAYRPLPIAEMTAFEQYLRGLLDSLGFELNAGIVWDAIPFSFVLDWFLDVGLIARQFRLDTLTLPIKLEDCYLQFKEVVTVDCDSDVTATANNTVARNAGASYERTVFHRLSAQPDYQSLVWLGWHFPSLNQAVLGLSLLV